MSTLNRTTGTNRRPSNQKPSRVFVLILAAAFLTFETRIAAFSYAYVDNLLRPGCAPVETELAGYFDQSIPTGKGYSLPAWWRPGTNGAAVILLPGNGGSRDSLRAEGELFASHGYAVLLLGPRACTGQLSTLGFREAADLQPAVKFLSTKPEIEWIAVLGFSAGGAAAILGAAQSPEIRAVIAEGHFRSLDHEINNSNAVPFLMEWQVQRWVSLWYRLRAGAWPSQVNSINQLPALAPRPILLIFGEREAENNAALEQFAAARQPRELWIVPGTGHGGYYQADPQEYARRLIGFLESARALP